MAVVDFKAAVTLLDNGWLKTTHNNRSKKNQPNARFTYKTN